MKVKSLILQWRIQSVIIMSIAFMWLMPYGSFDPKTLGFYMCIVLAVFNEYLLSKFIKFPKEKSPE